MVKRRRVEAAAKGRRIVSLLPSATEIVCALGLVEQLVGISHSCDYPETIRHLPRLSNPRVNLDGLSGGEIDAAIRSAMQHYGSVYEIDTPSLRNLAPDLVITQGICDVCAVPESQLIAASVDSEILTIDAHDLGAIVESILMIGRATGTGEQAERLVADMQRRIAAVEARVQDRPPPRVVALEWLDPPFVPGHWVPELVALAGGYLLAGTARRPSYRMDWSDLAALHPDVILVMPCGFNLEQARREADQHRDELRHLGGRIELLDASAYFSRSGPRVVDGLEILASTIFST